MVSWRPVSIAILSFGADAVGRRDEDRVAVAHPFEVEKSAEAANFSVGAGAGGRAHQWLDQIDHPIAGVDIDPGLRVSETARFFCHY